MNKLLSPQFLGVFTVFLLIFYAISPSAEENAKSLKLYCANVKAYKESHGKKGHPDYNWVRKGCEEITDVE